ncbi:methanobactin export MATE transporter MbnM [Nannocystis punicea]|uniref:Di-heme enzyme n=1 Tax=Nannocystis punicea TaxID=2995304 RepID=A0ABY7GXZ9_9BACT|nr:methanobactin export MATE transporter MbnM [Nannocystis poenicansa]WAS91856.1 di-heme enzyme [Nannocystis poenicansa]
MRVPLALTACLALVACDDGEPDRGYAWALGVGLPVPLVPEDNPMTAEKVELGRHLFYDTRLSGNETQSCASCHRQELAFTDGEALSTGSTGQRTPRNSMSLANIAYSTTYTWANPLLLDLEKQMMTPLFGFDPVELGLRGMEDVLIERLREEPRYEALFAEAFPADDDPFTLTNVTRALACFERSLLSGNSPYDRYLGGDQDAISESAKSGARLFASEKLECFHCHAGFNFQDSIAYEGRPPRNGIFHNTGLYNIDGKGGYPAGNTGLHEFTGVAADMGRFRVPTLRNVAVTAPYMHDGSIATLSEVLDHYAAGGRTIVDGPNAGVGSANPFKSSFIRGFELTEDERADVLAFLDSLTDDTFLTDPQLADPWQ